MFLVYYRVSKKIIYQTFCKADTENSRDYFLMNNQCSTIFRYFFTLCESLNMLWIKLWLIVFKKGSNTKYAIQYLKIYGFWLFYYYCNMRKYLQIRIVYINKLKKIPCCGLSDRMRSHTHYVVRVWLKLSKRIMYAKSDLKTKYHKNFFLNELTFFVQ